MSSRDEIAELVHRYSEAATRFDEAGWAGCWAEDAHWDLGGGRTAEGRDAIVRLWRDAMERLSALVQLVHNGTVSFADDGATAEGRWYLTEHVERRSGERSFLIATYDDTYRFDGTGWTFTSRRLTKLTTGPLDPATGFLFRYDDRA